jgi:hypothetical protein
MKFKFKPQTALLVGAVLATTYAEACWYSGTHALCFVANQQVDTIYYPDGVNSSAVVATGDFIADAPGGHTLTYQGTGSGGYSSVSGGTIYYPPFCTGPAKFTDLSGHSISLEWENDTTSSGFPGPSMYEDGTPTGATCS